MSKTALVTGGGSGVGQAIALALAAEGWRVGLVGRRDQALQQTIQQAGTNARQLAAFPCDIGDPSAVEKMAAEVFRQFGPVEVLVNAAGTNVPKRSLQELSRADYQRILDANLNGAFYCIQAFLPAM